MQRLKSTNVINPIENNKTSSRHGNGHFISVVMVMDYLISVVLVMDYFISVVMVMDYLLVLSW